MRTIKLLAIFVLGLALIISAGCERKITTESSGDGLTATDCFTCHGDDGYILAAQGEWMNSVHASGERVDYTNRSFCSDCHNHQGFVNRIEGGDNTPPYDMPSAIHCFTCHAPHERGDLTLRVTSAYTLENDVTFDHGAGNLCASCHHSFIDVRTIGANTYVSSTHWGSHHGPQSDLLEGTGGYEYSGVTYETSPHANALTGACVGCHMAEVPNFAGYELGGHSWNMTLEGSGAENIEVCAQESCHPSATSFDYDGAQTTVDSLLDSLEVMLYAEGLVDDGGHPVPDTIADAGEAGALYNFIIIHEDRSEGIHNFKYIKGLLDSSIDYMESVIAGKARGEEWAYNPKASH